MMINKNGQLLEFSHTYIRSVTGIQKKEPLDSQDKKNNNDTY